MGYEMNNWLRRWFNQIEIRGKKTLQSEDQIIARENPWEKLPNDIMEAITLQLSLKDYINISFVCKSWRSLLLQSDIVRPQIPWLLFPYNPRSHHIKFYDILEKKYHKFMLPKCVDGGRVVGCSRGWVVFMIKCYYGMEISLFNPIFGVKYLLPLLPRTTYLGRIELSSSNISDCTVAVILDNFKKLALCKLGDHERWEVFVVMNRVGSIASTLVDVLFCKQRLHVLIRSENGNGKIENMVVKLRNSDETILIVLVHDLNYKDNREIVEVDWIPSHAYTRYKLFLRHLHISYLVESTKGRVMLIQKHHGLFYITQNRPVSTIQESFDIIGDAEITDDDSDSDSDDDDDFSYDEEDYDGEDEVTNWNEVVEVDISKFMEVVNHLDGFKIYEIEDLIKNKKTCKKGLGKEETLFLSNRSRVCLRSNASNRLQGNNVHFLMDNARMHEDCAVFFIGHNGIHHLDNSTIHDLIPKSKIFWNSKFMWFAPNLML